MSDSETSGSDVMEEKSFQFGHESDSDDAIDEILDSDKVPSFLLYNNLEKDTELPQKSKKKRVKEVQSKTDDNASLSDSDMEAEYERRPRVQASSTQDWNNKGVVKRLPVKQSDGTIGFEKTNKLPGSNNESRVVKPKVSKPSNNSTNIEIGKDTKEKTEEGNGDHENRKEETRTEKRRREKEELLRRYYAMTIDEKRNRVQKTKSEIASLCQKLMAKPEAGVHSSNEEESTLRQMLELCKDPDNTVRKLSLLSLVAVFRDIIPDYRIRLATSEEKKNRLKKEIRLLWRFERELLEGYQAYLQILNTLLGDGDGSSLARISIRCMCTMLVSKPHFNFRENLLKTVVMKINSTDDDISKQCVACVETILKDDPTSEVTLEVVTHISKLMKGENSSKRCRKELILVTLNCILVADMKDLKRAEEAKILKKKRKRRRKQQDEATKAMEETSAAADPFLKHARQTESLRELFLMYLRLLKKAPKSDLLSPVLKGIAKYVHLINLDLVQSLSQILTQHIKAGNFGIESSLRAIHTMMITLQGPGKELQVDESEFVVSLYRLIHQLQFEHDRDEHTLSMIECIETLFLRRVQQQNNRVTAFVLQLANLALHVQPHSALAITSIIRALMHRYKTACDSLFDIEADMVVGSLSNSSDPLLQDRTLSPLWPLAQLQFHYQPFLSTFAKKALARAPLVPTQRAFQVYKDYNPNTGGFNPPVQKPRNREQANSKKKKRKANEQLDLAQVSAFDPLEAMDFHPPNQLYFRNLLLHAL